MADSPTAHKIRFSLAGGVLGLVALLLVSAILGGALSAFRAFQTIDHLSGQLTSARTQIDALRDDNNELAEQNRQILKQNKALVRYLRKHGLSIPRIVDIPTSAAEKETDHPRPKAPAVSERPNGPTNQSPPPNPSPKAEPPILCVLAPVVCQ